MRIGVHPSRISKAPGIVELLRKWDFKESTQIVAESCLNKAEKDFEKAAVCYLKKEQAVWSRWRTIDATEKVRKALRDQ